MIFRASRLQNGSSPVDDKGYRVVDGNMVNKLEHVFAPRGLVAEGLIYSSRVRLHTLVSESNDDC